MADPGDPNKRAELPVLPFRPANRSFAGSQYGGSATHSEAPSRFPEAASRAPAPSDAGTDHTFGPSRFMGARAPSEAGSNRSRFNESQLNQSQFNQSQFNFRAPTVAGSSHETPHSRVWRRDQQRPSRYRGPMSTYTPSTGGVFHAPSVRDPGMSQQTESRLANDRSKKRKLEQSERYVAAKAAPAPAQHAQVVRDRNDFDDYDDPRFRQVPLTDARVTTNNANYRPSNIYALHHDSPQLNIYTPLDPRNGRFVAKAVCSDEASMEAFKQTVGAIGKRRGASIVVATLDFRTVEMDENIPEYRAHVEALANADVFAATQGTIKCANCGKGGHTVHECASPQAPTGKFASSGGTIDACPKCNSKLHLIDDCKVLATQMASLTREDKLTLLGDLVGWGRYNRPAVRTERWFYFDLLAEWNDLGLLGPEHLANPIGNYVPWSHRFARELGVATGAKVGMNHPKYLNEYSGDVARSLPKDPFWEGKTMAQALEMHKAGAWDELRYISKATRAERFDSKGPIAMTLMEITNMFAEETGLMGPPRIDDPVNDIGLLVDDEIPAQTATVVDLQDSPCGELRFGVTQLLNPGDWSPHPTGIVVNAGDGSQTTTPFLKFEPTDQCAALQKEHPVLFQKAKRAFNMYRLKRIDADKFDDADMCENFLASVAAYARTLRLRVQNEKAAEDAEEYNLDFSLGANEAHAEQAPEEHAEQAPEEATPKEPVNEGHQPEKSTAPGEDEPMTDAAAAQTGDGNEIEKHLEELLKAGAGKKDEIGWEDPEDDVDQFAIKD